MIDLHPLFTAGCVLPVRKPIILRGHCDGDSVSCFLKDSSGRVLTQATGLSDHGEWCLTMPAVEQPCTGLSITAICGEDTVTAGDVCVGLVFMAGGQSNMELCLCDVNGGKDAVSSHNDSLLRWYMVPKESREERAAEAEKHCRWISMTPGCCPDMSAIGYFFGERLRKETGMPVGIVGCYWGGTSVMAWLSQNTLESMPEGRDCLERWHREAPDISMEEWQTRDDKFMHDLQIWNEKVSRCRAEHPGIEWTEIERLCGVFVWDPPKGPGSPYRPAGLAGTMVSRMLPLGLSGILYYQGESDVWMDDGKQYEVLLTALIREWRAGTSDPDLPFINIQLPGYNDQGNLNWPKIRKAQAAVDRTVPHTMLAGILDLGEKDNIHPLEKRIPANRLADAWMVHEGLLSPECMCPRITGMCSDRDTIKLTVDLPLAPAAQPVRNFELQDQQGEWHPASAELEEHSITLSCPDITPVDYRYAWFNWGTVNVFGVNGRPLIPD